MKGLDQVWGALAAAVLAWVAIALFAVLGARVRQGPLRVAGAAALGTLALAVAGVPLPGWLPLVWLVIGIVWGLRPVAPGGSADSLM